MKGREAMQAHEDSSGNRPSLVILDRDGVINHDSPHFIKSAEECIPLPGSLEAIARLSKAGYRVAVATNQSGVARGLLTESDLAAMHAKLQQGVAALGGELSAFFYCPHSPEDNCTCRKPSPGLVHRIGEHFGVPVVGAPFVGDATRDLEAARNAGCQPVLVLTGKGELTRSQVDPGLLAATLIYPDLAAFVDDFLDVR